MVTQKSHLSYRRIDKLKMATAMLDHIDRFFGLPTGLFCTSCFTADLGAREAEGLGGLIDCDHPLFMNVTAKSQVASVALL